MQKEPRNTFQWLKANAVAISMDKLGGYMERMCWYVHESLHPELIDFMTRDPSIEVIHGGTKNYIYMPSRFGFIIIDNLVLNDDQIVVYDGMKIVKPELDRSCWFKPTSTFITQMKTLTTQFIVSEEEKRAKKAQEDHVKAIAYQEKIERVEKEQRALCSDPEFQLLINKAVNFDHTFEESCDHKYAMRTRQDLRLLEAELSKFGVNGKEVMSKIISSHYGYM